MYKRNEEVYKEHREMSLEEADKIMKELDDDDIVPFADDFSSREQNFLDCSVDDDCDCDG